MKDVRLISGFLLLVVYGLAFLRFCLEDICSPGSGVFKAVMTTAGEFGFAPQRLLSFVLEEEKVNAGK